MFEKILSITKNYAIVKISNNIVGDILNFNVVFEDNNKFILGEIDEIVNYEAKISFLGEFINGKFYSGIIRKPTMNSFVRIINKNELNELIGGNDPKSMILGNSPLYNNSYIRINIDDFFSNHMAIFGNTGSGKTCGVARIIQNFFGMKDKVPFNSNIFIFNNTSEYDSAFREIGKINSNFHYKMYTTDRSLNSENLIHIPLWLLNVDDYANLLGVTDFFQISIIEKMLSLVSVFARNDENSIKYKNHLIAKAIIATMYSNQVAAKIRDQIFSILQDCRTEELNLDVQVPGIGYTREFRKCFDIDNHGDFVERVLVTKYIQSFVHNEIKWKEDYVPIYFTMDDLEVALNFALISEGFLLNETTANYAIELKVKLHTLNNTNNRVFFEYNNFVTKEQYIYSLITTKNKEKVQLVNFILEDIDDRLAKSIVKIYSRMLFRFEKGMKTRGAMPFLLILEEAHRYVQKDIDNEIMGYNIFERIAKEGRKFGLILCLISQRPTELSETVLSQCSNFIIFKLNHPTDLEYIKKMVPNISADVIEKQKSLQSGTCVAFGRITKIPIIVRMQMPNPPPQSSNASIYNRWIIELKN